MKTKIGVICLLLIFMLTAVSGCSAKGKQAADTQSAEQSDTQSAARPAALSDTQDLQSDGQDVTFTDALGRSVEVDDPQRVVTMIGSFTDIWYLAGGTVVAAGQDSWTSFDLDLPDDVVNLGSLLEPNVEKLIAADPDLVIADSRLDSNLELKDTLDAAGIKVAYFDVSGFDDYLNMLDICTRITGKRENYEKYGTEVKKQINATLKRADGSHPSVLYLRATADGVKAKNSKDNVGTEMLKELGCRNIADSDSSLLTDLSMEAIVSDDPDYIFVTSLSDNADSALKELTSDPAWSSLKAVKEGHYYVLDKKLYNSKPDARWGEAYEKLADILYGKK